MPKQTNKNKQVQNKKGGKQSQKKPNAKTAVTEKKPKKPIQKSTKQNPVAKYKNKTSKATSLLATGAKMDGRKILSQKSNQSPRSATSSPTILSPKLSYFHQPRSFSRNSVRRSAARRVSGSSAAIRPVSCRHRRWQEAGR